MKQQTLDLFEHVEVRFPRREPHSCIRAAHWPIRIEGKYKPDSDYWCAYCGARNLPVPSPRKSWE